MKSIENLIFVWNYSSIQTDYTKYIYIYIYIYIDVLNPTLDTCFNQRCKM